MVTATYALNWATTQTSFEATAWSDETARMVKATAKRGRDDVNGQFQPGMMTLTMLNSDGRYSYGNAASAFYPNATLMRAVKLEATYSAVTYPVFYGFVASIQPDPSPTGPQHCTVTVVDALAVISNILTTFETASKGAKTIGQLIELALAPDSIGDGIAGFEWPIKDIETTTTTYSNVTYSNVAMLAIIQQLAEHEGGLIYCAADGDVTFRSRASRLTRAECITSQGTITDMLALDAAVEVNDVLNSVTATYNAGASTVTEDDVTSINAYGLRPLGFDIDLITSLATATAEADWRLLRFDAPALRPRMQMVNSTAALLTQILARDISHRVTITDATGITGIDEDFFIEGIEHEISDGGTVHRCTWQLSPISGWAAWSLGVTGFSELGVSTYLN